MSFVEDMERLEDERQELWDRGQARQSEQEHLVAENMGICLFCGGDIHAFKDCKEGWNIYCSDCAASTPYTKTFGEALSYWNAMVQVKKDNDGTEY